MLRLAKKIEARNDGLKSKPGGFKSSPSRDGSDHGRVSRVGGAKPRRATLGKLNLYDDKDDPEENMDEVRVLMFVL